MSKMKVLSAIAAALVCAPVALVAQNKAATYITKEQVDTVNKQQGTDRTIRVLDIGHENFAVGVVHRGATGAQPAAPAAGRMQDEAARSAAERPAAPVESLRRGRQHAASRRARRPGCIHESQTEGYYIISGAGTMVTGGRIVNGRKSARGRRGDDDAQWSVVQRQHHGAGRGDAGSEGRRHHHHSGGRSARMDDDSRSRRLSQLPPVAACADGRLRAPVDCRTEIGKSEV